jgi:hypothetical protein
MTHNLIRSIIFVALLSVINGCISEVENNVPDLDNLIVVAERQSGLQSISLIKELEFASSESELIAKAGQFDVDDIGRVYIGDAMQHRVHVFGSNGHYQAYFGREGSGPGEFRAMGSLTYSDGYLYVYDPLMMRLSAFLTDTFEESNTIYIQAINKREIEELSGLIQNGFMFIGPNTFLVNFNSRLVPNPDYDGYNLNDTYRTYHLMDRNRRLELNRVFKKPDYRALSATVGGKYRFTQFEFLGSTLLAASENSIYMARSGKFLIKVYNTESSYQRAYYYPYQKQRFTREEAIRQQIADYEEGVFEWRVSVIEHAPEGQIPDTWPALNDLIVDDENRLWVSTIVENFDVYEWWILEESGELITTFEWPRNEPIEVIKNGKMYTRQTDEETGLQQVVRYRVEME